jgi:DNA-binding Xre family transcriptional regulator
MMAKEIQKILIEKSMKKGELAERCGWGRNNFYNKLKRDDFSESELRNMAEALGCELKIEFIPKAGK